MFAPINYNFSNKKALVVGASKTGLDRAEKLSEYGCDVTILSEEFPENLNLELFKTKHKIFNYNDMIGFDLVVAATNNTPLNMSIVKIGKDMGLITNSVNYDEEENFQFPASFQIDNLFVSVSTSGKLPFLAKKIKDEIKQKFGPEFRSYLRLLTEARELLNLNKSLTPEERLEEFKRLQDFSVKELREYNDSIISKNKQVVRIGTRRSNLALRQTNKIIEKLAKEYPEKIFIAKPIRTTGDRRIKRTIQSLGGKASFIKEFNNALTNGEIDFAIHSAKDIDLNQLEDTKILDIFPEREDSVDVLITKTPIEDIEGINNEMVIGTGSIRRKTFLANLNDNFKAKNIRGNVETRIKKLLNENFDGIILAKAGLNRLEIDNKKLADNNLYVNELEFTPAPLQGVLAFQTVKDNDEIKDLLKVTKDQKTTKEANLELKIQETFNIDCTVPFGALVNNEDNKITVKITTFPEGKQKDFIKSYLSENEFLNELEELKIDLGDNLG